MALKTQIVKSRVLASVTMAPNKPTHAHVSIYCLGGVNERVPVEYRGKSVYVPDPIIKKTYRLNAEKFIAGECQIRDSWAIMLWNERSEQMRESEKNWQT